MTKEQEELLCKLCGVNDLNEIIKGIGCSADEIKIVDEINMKGEQKQ